MKIVFIGNCQAGSLRHVYARFVQPHTRHEVFHVATHEDLSEANRQRIQAADAVALQMQDFSTKAGAMPLPDGVPVYRFPVVSGAFLWPFSGRERPGNKNVPIRPGGSYPAQLGDSWLNRMIRDGVDAEEATRQYLALDVATVTDFDRLYRITLAKQRRMDDALGFQVASIIDEHFRDEPLFLTAYHPGMRIMKHLAVTVFRAMGVDEAIVDRMGRLFRHDLSLPLSEVPIHPSIARHFGLRFVTPDKPYRFHNEGAYTFEEWAHRYMEGAWNPDLAEGAVDTQQRRAPGPTIEKLRNGLALSPRSGPGWATLGLNLLRTGQKSEAVEAVRTAVELDPDNPTIRAICGDILLRAGLHNEAADVLAHALALDPAARNVRRLLPLALMHARRFQEALAVVRDQIDDPLDPPTSEQQAMLARLYSRTGDALQALAWAERAADAQPVHPSAMSVLADTLAQQGRHREAQFCLREALAARPDTPSLLYALARSLQASGDDEGAIEAIQRAIVVDAGKWPFHALLSRLLARVSRFQEAKQACQAALALHPSDDSLRKHLAMVQSHIAPRPQAA